MPLLSGETLDNRVSQSGSLSGQELLRVAREIALGLVAAHSNGVIHRDIKPSNLWLEEPYGRIKILDFGLARMDEEDQALTVTGSFIGTPMYMSPEQADGLKLDERSELFSFGAVLYFAATGESPFRRSTLTATLHAIGYAEPAIPHTVNKVIPETFSGLIMWLLSKKADDRPSSAVEVLELVELIVADELSPSSDEPSIDISHTDEPSNDIEEDIEDQVHDPRYDEPLIDIDISSIISTDESLKLAHRAMTTVQDFINEVHYVISSEVAPGTYGRKWLLQDRDTRRVLGSRKRRGYAPKDDLRLLSDAAVFPGTRWEVLKLDLK
jgi:serine/threonine protein kinase